MSLSIDKKSSYIICTQTQTVEIICTGKLFIKKEWNWCSHCTQSVN